jgi:hypothetical protein
VTRFARVAVVVLTIGVLGAIPVALATSPGKDGRIVYMVKDEAGSAVRVARSRYQHRAVAL